MDCAQPGPEAPSPEEVGSGSHGHVSTIAGDGHQPPGASMMAKPHASGNRPASPQGNLTLGSWTDNGNSRPDETTGVPPSVLSSELSNPVKHKTLGLKVSNNSANT